MFTINIQYPITQQQVCDAVSTAFEGGYCEWLHEVNHKQGLRHPESKLVWYGHDDAYDENLIFTIKFDGPDDAEGSAASSKDVTMKELLAGFEIMAKKYPKHFVDLITGNGDAITADVYFQCVVFGEIIYS